MSLFEYKVVPAPSKGRKARGIKGTENRFAFALESVMNDMAAEGWEFQRTETLPSEERSGLTSSTTHFRNVMVFRRPRADDVSAFRPKLLERPADDEQSAETPPHGAVTEGTPPQVPAQSYASETGEAEPDDLPVALVTRAQAAENTEDDATKDKVTGA